MTNITEPDRQPDLNELMEKDPLFLTRENRFDLIKGFRAMRKKFNLGDTKAGSMKKPAKPKALADVDINTKDLGIDL